MFKYNDKEEDFYVHFSLPVIIDILCNFKVNFKKWHKEQIRTVKSRLSLSYGFNRLSRAMNVMLVLDENAILMSVISAVIEVR